MASSMQEYLKRYGSEADKPKKKKKKKKKDNASKGKGGLTIVDADPVWQKEVNEASSESEAEEGDAPLVVEDVEFKRMQRLEALRMRPYLATAADGSGWISINQGSSEKSIGFAMSRSQKEHAQDVSPLQSGTEHDGVESSLKSRERGRRKSCHDTPDRDLSPPRSLAAASKRYPDSSQPSPPKILDLSPPRRRQTSSITGHHDSPESSPPRTGKLLDLSPPRRRQTFLRSGHHDSPQSSPPRTERNVDLSPLRGRQTSFKSGRHDSPESSPPRTGKNADLSPPRRKHTLGGYDSPESSSPRAGQNVDLSPPRTKQPPSRKGRHDSSESSPSRAAKNLDSSPPRRRLTSTRTPPRRSQASMRTAEHDEDDTDLSPKRRFNNDDSDFRGPKKLKRTEIMADSTAAGLQSGKQLAKETEKKKQDDSARLKEVNISISGRHASTVYRDKHGKRLEGVDEILKLQQAEEPKKEEKPLEWGRGLVQKREAEARYAELEAEKEKPFARSRDDPDLDKALKEQIRWGDPMAHLVKKKVSEPVLVDLGANELMKESGFIVPQAIPNHSWLKRGVAAPPNRYGIKPGRHWDGVDRSNGYEKEMFKRQNEKAAERTEAYLWSVADM